MNQTLWPYPAMMGSLTKHHHVAAACFALIERKLLSIKFRKLKYDWLYNFLYLQKQIQINSIIDPSVPIRSFFGNYLIILKRKLLL